MCSQSITLVVAATSCTRWWSASDMVERFKRAGHGKDRNAATRPGSSGSGQLCLVVLVVLGFSLRNLATHVRDAQKPYRKHQRGGRSASQGERRASRRAICPPLVQFLPFQSLTRSRRGRRQKPSLSPAWRHPRSCRQGPGHRRRPPHPRRWRPRRPWRCAAPPCTTRRSA
jgi:hypothetical protein